MILITNLKLPLDTDFNNLLPAVKSLRGLKGFAVESVSLYRKSVDARKKEDVHFCCSLLVSLKSGEEKAVKVLKNAKLFCEPEYNFPTASYQPKNRPVVVGFGPAGIFAAYTLAKAGLRPIVLERGADIDRRNRDVQSFWQGGKLDPESNVQFGEGGAGTFSDGKLTTGIKDIRCRTVLKIFHENGAKKEILTDAKPHIGTDVLSVVIKNIRRQLLSMGAEIHFLSRLEALHFEDGRLTAIDVKGENGLDTLACDRLILAVGHSARDTLAMLKENEIEMIRKPFAVGVRIEHRQDKINRALYGGAASHPALAAADYKLAVHLANGRGVYTFCMCPGGQVVNASSEEGRVAVNGMSLSARDGENANSAVLTEVLPTDLAGDDLLAGVEFQRGIEAAAYRLTGGKGVPVQTLGGYLYGKDCEPGVTPTVLPRAVFADVSSVFPAFINTSLKEGITALGKKLPGFSDPDAVITAPETRSSSPVRILRDETLQSVSLRGLYPCGEGAGYAGGIMSAAVDGIRCAEALIETIEDEREKGGR